MDTAVLSIVPTTSAPTTADSTETATALRRLADAADRGELQGFAGTFMFKGIGHTAEVAGVAKRCPVYVTGGLHALQLQLDRLIKDRWK